MRALTLPRKLNRYKGVQFWRFQVRVEQSGVNRTFWQHSLTLPVIAATPADACNLVKAEFAPLVEHPTEIECAGPKGGVTARFIGYEALIWAKMCVEQGDWEQMKLL